MNIDEIKKLKYQYIESKKKELPMHVLEMGLNMLYKEPIDIKSILSGNCNEIAELKDFNQDKIYNIDKNICALIVNSDETILNGSLDNLSFAKENFNLPIIANDYFLEEYQVYLIRIYQADGIIIDPNLINDETLEKISLLSLAMGIEPIFKINTQYDLERIQKYDFANVFIFDNENLLESVEKSKFNIFYDKNNREKLIERGVNIFIRVLT